MEYEYGPDAGRAHSTGEREDGEMASCPVAEESKPLVGNDPENCEGAGGELSGMVADRPECCH